MDHEGMKIPASLTADHSSVHQEFTKYLSSTGNTICGRHPIGVLVAAVECLVERKSETILKWVRYEQSSQCETINDSSVSYASAYIIV
jgi:MEMO1 family protein